MESGLKTDDGEQLSRADLIARIIDPVSFEKVRQGGQMDDAQWRCNRARDKAAHIETLFATRAPSDAALVEALEEAEATLALCEHPRSEDRSYGPEVDELGRRIGFGALMSSAQASWRKYLHDKGNPLGGEFVAGPTFGTVTRTLGIIRSALAAAKGQP